MKNTLKVVLIVIGLGFAVFGLFDIFQTAGYEIRRQLYAMIGVGVLFILAGFSMGKR